MQRATGTPVQQLWPLLWLLGLGLSLGLGCAGIALSPGIRLAYFEAPAPDDPWSGKISGWQRRERADSARLEPILAPVAQAAAPALFPAAPGAVPGVGVDLRSKYERFLSQRKRAAAREFAAWIQAQAKQHYVADGPIDHWATMEETLRADGDDCDGLELLTYHGLREIGFSDDEVYRAIVYRPSDGQHHMVTLWFESRDDPWVLDPTGAMTTGMPRMSDLRAWVPLKVFGEASEFSVGRAPKAHAPAELAAN